jgi:hypothetical protein
MADGMGDRGTVMQRGSPVRDEIGMLFFVCRDSAAAAATMGGHATQVRKTPSWPRSWANFSLL